MYKHKICLVWFSKAIYTVSQPTGIADAVKSADNKKKWEATISSVEQESFCLISSEETNMRRAQCLSELEILKIRGALSLCPSLWDWVDKCYVPIVSPFKTGTQWTNLLRGLLNYSLIIYMCVRERMATSILKKKNKVTGKNMQLHDRCSESTLSIIFLHGRSLRCRVFRSGINDYNYTYEINSQKPLFILPQYSNRTDV